MTLRLTAITLGVQFLLMACGSVGVKPSRFGGEAASRPPDCTVEFLHKPPERAYDELGEMYSYYSWVAEPQHVLREKACALGADAVIVTRDFLISTVHGPDRKLVVGIAIKYRDRQEPGHPRERAARLERGTSATEP
jgi:hypothetical protein